MDSKERKMIAGKGQYDPLKELYRQGRDTANVKNYRNSRSEAGTDVPQEQRALIIGRSHRRNELKCISHDVLKTWVAMQDAGPLILTMTSELPQLEVLLNQAKISDYMVDLLIDAISHALTAQHQKESIRQLLDTLCRTKFMGHLTDHLKCKEITKETWDDAKDFFTSYLHILKEILDKLPQYAHICASKASELSQSVSVCDSIKTKASLLNEIKELTEESLKIYRAQKDKEKRSLGGLIQSRDFEEPPEDFLTLTVIPTIADLQENARPFIRAAEIEGGYKNIQHYLDVQFRLMREDFICPLRDAIVKFRQSGCKKYFTSSDVKFFYDVKIIGTVISERIDHCLQFNVSSPKFSAEQTLKHFVFGSLLCLSKDNFESAIFATITQCDMDHLAKGIILVNFKTGLDEVFSSTSNDLYIVAETTAYFESYCHVLEGLQEMVSKLPLQDYIVHCKTKIKPPRYLLPTDGVRRVPRFELSCLTESKMPCRVPVLTTVKWPKADAMCLNESQRQAAQLALTKELAIIQGPPGTGKTYVGLKVMQVLLENKDTMAGNDSKSNDPILVVCYTNHALDQFLEGVLNFCPDGIVRVGGRSKSEKLEKFNLTELKQNQNLQKSYVKQSVKESGVEMDKVSIQITQLNEIMESLQTEIISETLLEVYIKPSHYDSLVNTREQTNNSGQINVWLRTDNKNIRSVIPEMIKQQLTTLVLTLETTSSVRHLTKKMNIIDRARLYHLYVNKYRSISKKEINMLSSKKQSNETRNKIRTIENYLKDAQNNILGDGEMKKVLPQAFLENISRYLTSNNNEFVVPSDGVVESWLLGLSKDLQTQLDDVEFIKNHNKKGEENDVYFDDVYNREQNDRTVDDDSANVAGSEEGVRSALNSMTSVIQRAQALGIIDDISTEQETEVEEGTTEWTIHMKPLHMIKVLNKLRSTEAASEETENSITNIWDLEVNERFSLYNLWINRYKKFLAHKMHELVNKYTSLQEKRQQAKSEETLSVLRHAKVIGMTTSGAARLRDVLQAVGCRIIVVEEAAEVLESHIVTSLNKHCKHLILIGDHQQLRPKTAVYQLAIEFGLEISLFERLIKNNVPHVMLKEQHRMRPEISQIMRHIYPDLQDHTSVTNYEKIRGVSKNIFFIQHSHRETQLDDSMSKANAHEAKFLVAMYRFLLKQGYEVSRITMLATYAGQVSEIYKILDQEEKEHVILTTVDNYQGEENDIILLSLVRSNADNQTGFLKVDNRVCVALSRAKKGLYVIGNLDLMASQSKLWSKIISTAKAEQIIGTGLPVICEKHPDFKRLMTSDKDFQKLPEGGCGRPCQYPLPCGHTCGLTCHGYDPEHLQNKCKKPCNKKCEAGHSCIKPCSEPCGKCTVLIPKKIPICGHEDQVACYLPAQEAICGQGCEHILDCGHRCSGRCGQCRKKKEHTKCAAPAEYKWECGHTGKVPCNDIPPRYPCKQSCGTVLQCGHKCQGTCVDCLGGAVHVACKEYCEKKKPCGHPCKDYCGVPCSPCERWCPFQCRHGSCNKKDPRPRCGHKCEPCLEDCLYGCRHGHCSRKCSEDCDFNCKQPCHKVQNFQENNEIQDKCSGLCGELCLWRKYEKVSQTSSPSEKEEALKTNCASGLTHSSGGTSSGSVAKGRQQTATTNITGTQEKKGPLIKIPKCSHVFFVRDLDEHVYGFGQHGTSYIPCPVCENPILKCRRYETINKARTRDREAAKMKLVRYHSFPKKLKNDLLKSHERLKDYPELKQFHSLEVEEVETAVEVYAASFKFKCAFLLNTIFSISGNGHKQSSLKLIESRKQAVANIPWRLTSQQKEEFVTEMSRCLWLLYLSHLVSLRPVEVVNGPFSTGSDDEVHKVIEELNKLKPADDLLEKAEHISVEIRERIKKTLKMAEKGDLDVLEQTIMRASMVIRSSDDQMLCHLLHENAKKGDPDSQESEGWTTVEDKRKRASTGKQKQQKEEQQPPPQQQPKTSNNGNIQPARSQSTATPGAGANKRNMQQQQQQQPPPQQQQQQKTPNSGTKQPAGSKTTATPGAGATKRNTQQHGAHRKKGK